MSQAYSNPSRESDPHALPDVEVFELTAEEVAEHDEELIHTYMQKHEFRLAAMSGRVREAMFQAMIDDGAVSGGWFWWSCFPGCLPDGPPMGPFATRAEALADAQYDTNPDDILAA